MTAITSSKQQLSRDVETLQTYYGKNQEATQFINQVREVLNLIDSEVEEIKQKKKQKMHESVIAFRKFLSSVNKEIEISKQIIEERKDL